MAVVGAYTVYLNIEYFLQEDTVPVAETEEIMDHNQHQMQPEDGAMKYSPNLDLKGTHIMNNGEVMTGSGVVISDAVIREDGMIEFPDGSELKPAMDMR